MRLATFCRENRRLFSRFLIIVIAFWLSSFSSFAHAAPAMCLAEKSDKLGLWPPKGVKKGIGCDDLGSLEAIRKLSEEILNECIGKVVTHSSKLIMETGKFLLYSERSLANFEELQSDTYLEALGLFGKIKSMAKGPGSYLSDCASGGVWEYIGKNHSATLKTLNDARTLATKITERAKDLETTDKLSMTDFKDVLESVDKFDEKLKEVNSDFYDIQNKLVDVLPDFAKYILYSQMSSDAIAGLIFPELKDLTKCELSNPLRDADRKIEKAQYLLKRYWRMAKEYEHFYTTWFKCDKDKKLPLAAQGRGELFHAWRRSHYSDFLSRAKTQIQNSLRLMKATDSRCDTVARMKKEFEKRAKKDHKRKEEMLDTLSLLKNKVTACKGLNEATQKVASLRRESEENSCLRMESNLLQFAQFVEKQKNFCADPAAPIVMQGDLGETEPMGMQHKEEVGTCARNERGRGDCWVHFKKSVRKRKAGGVHEWTTEAWTGGKNISIRQPFDKWLCSVGYGGQSGWESCTSKGFHSVAVDCKKTRFDEYNVEILATTSKLPDIYKKKMKTRGKIVIQKSTRVVLPKCPVPDRVIIPPGVAPPGSGR